MEKRETIILAIIISLLGHFNGTNAQFSFQRITTLFKKSDSQETYHKEFSTAKIKTVIIENINGPINIKTWKKNSLLLKSTKHAAKQEHIDGMHIIINQTDDQKLTIASGYKTAIKKGTIEYELIVPEQLSMNLKTINGNITVTNFDGPIQATTENGTIELVNIKKAAHVTTTKKGRISIEGAYGPVSAAAYQGDIFMTNTHNSIIANTIKGKVQINCKKVPTTGIVKLETSSGPVILSLPKQTNASIKGQTSHGTVYCEHYIHLKPRTTKLNSSAWQLFKQEVDGTLGTGEATISLTSTYGNVKIMETDIT